MKIRKNSIKKSILFALVGLLGILTFNTPVNAATDHISGSYSGVEDETIIITSNGIYTFNVYGGQGGSYSTYTGGNGGYVSFSKELKVGDTIRVVTGAGGGTGTLTNGGGYSAIYINGTLAGVAGGGGGAGSTANGGNGGAANSGNNSTSLYGSSSTDANTSGGGAGHKGGSSGYAIYHNHASSGCSYHSHGSGCYYRPAYSCGGPFSQYNGWYYCSSCGVGLTAAVTHTAYGAQVLNCSTPVGYRCGKNESYVESSVASVGGSNYINTSLVTTLANYSGNNEGEAKVTISYVINLSLNTNKPTGTNNNPVLNQTTVTVVNDVITAEMPKPELIGYDFLGWTTTKNPGDNPIYVETNMFIDSTKISTLYAQWSPRTLDIILDKNNTYADTISTTTLPHVYDTVYNLPTPTSKYSNFKNWSLDAAGTKKITNNSTKVQRADTTTETTVYAQWTPAQVTLKFDATTNGGTLSGSSSKTVTNESVVGTLPTATKSGYNFLGWFTSATDGDPITEGTVALFDKSQSTYTLYAQFEPKVTDWPFGYTGQTQTWTAPSSGYYLFEAYGAQGGDYSSNAGGKGGFVSGVKFLNKGDVIYINVGGQGSLFNGGGQGAVSHGGGGTDFRLNGTAAGNRFLVAGGGGGATGTKAGGNGGISGSGNNNTPVNGNTHTGEGGAGGGGGYNGGTHGYLIRHYHASSGCSYHSHSGGCTVRESWGCSGPFSHTATVYPGFPNGIYYCNGRSCGIGLSAPCPHTAYGGYINVCGKSAGWSCGKSDGQIVGEAASVGGSNYVDRTLYYQQNQGGVRSGNGYAKITAMYTVVLDTNKPSTTNHYTANATNIPFIDNVDTLLNESSLPYATPNYTSFESTGDDANKKTYGLYFVRDMFTYDSYEKLPVPTLKGWKFLGWYTYPQIDAGVKVTDSTQVKITNGLTLLDNHILYAHWEPETYYIKYYMNNTNKNVYGDNYTDPVAKFDTTLNGAVKSGATKYIYNASEDCYIQTVKYDHNIEVLPKYYAKTGYYFKNWTNKADTTLAGTKGTGTGTGKQTGTGYYESDILTQVKNGENFQAGKGNFNYITNEKALSLGTATEPIWSYGNQTVVFYATWEPIKYQLRFNGTDNWNDSSSFSIGTYTGEDSYLQKIGNGTKIRYDQIFTLDANLFKREAPHTIQSEDGLSVVLKSGYGHIGWGFGQNTMSYSASPSYKLISMNTKADNEQALTGDADTTGRDYEEKQSNVKNVISEAGIQKITKYISDWSNARTDSNRKDKTNIENNIIESNLHSLWRRNANDNHINEDTTGCPCPDDSNGGCICPSDQCPDRDNDGTCDYHDPDPDDPTIPSKCPCGTDENGNCICPSDTCPDNDKDGVCDNHDPNPNDPTIPNDGHDHDNSCPCGPDGNGNCKCPSSNCPDNDKDGVCDNHDPDPNNPNIPNMNGDDNDDCPCGSDGNGNCICPSDTCPDRDGDGICDNHDPDPDNPNIPSRCPCGTDSNGNCICPSDSCPDKDGDGVCDNHDPDPNNPYIPSVNKCPCGTDSNGNCNCPSDNCPDNDKDGVCDNHDPDPNNPNIPNNQGSGSGGGDNNGGDPTNPNDTNFGITLTFDLNGGYLNVKNKFNYGPIVLKQELFNDYFYEFDIIGNVNKDHLNHTAVADIYGAYSNTNTPKKNYNAYTGLNVIYNKGDGNGGLYRLSGWSTNKGAIYPDYKVTIDGIKNNNFDTFDAANNNNTIKICNDTTLYAVWEPVLQMNVELTNTVTGNKVKTGTLTDATQENMQRNGLPTLAVKPGQEIKYLIAIRGENKATVGSRIEPMNLQVEFDSVMTGIYKSQYKDLHDGLNEIGADDTDDPNETMLLSTSNLNRKFVKQTNKSIIRKFSIPLYLGTERAEEVGYPSFKEDGYTLNITLSRPSNFYKGDEVVTAKLILDTTGKLAGSNGSGGSGSGSGGNGGGSGGNGTGSNLPSATVGEFRTNIRIR